MDAVDISRKLCLTAAIVGARTLKDLAAAFRRANPRTPFDVERANKWLQGRARPREQQVYDDWAALLGGVTGPWIAETSFDDFAERICEGREEDRETLMRRAGAFGGDEFRAAAVRHGGEGGANLAGLYVTYSYAWSPYFPGRLIRGAFEIRSTAGGLAATYLQTRITDRLEAAGPVSLLRRALLADLREQQERTAFQFTLFPPMSLASVLGGLVCGPAVLGADPQPSVSRVVMVRLRSPTERLAGDCVLDEGASIAADLAALGACLPDLAEADRRLDGFLAAPVGGPYDHVTLDSFRPLVALFDEEWMAPAAAP